MKTLTFDPLVQSDLRKTKSYYERQRRGLGKDFMTCVLNQFERIALYPLAAPTVEKNVRKIGIEKFPFEIYYLLNDQEIFIFAVVHVRRHQDFWRRRL